MIFSAIVTSYSQYQTLDALPAHLLTPFNGPVPPSNLLDKVARGVCQSKGPVEWPHSIRATRVKLLEVAKSRAKEEAIEGRKVIAEESECDFDEEMPEFHEKDVLQPTTNIQRKRPLYRQSSMDFINTELKDNERCVYKPSQLFVSHSLVGAVFLALTVSFEHSILIRPTVPAVFSTARRRLHLQAQCRRSSILQPRLRQLSTRSTPSA